MLRTRLLSFLQPHLSGSRSGLALLVALVCSMHLNAQTRLGIFYTQQELDSWRQRAASTTGPYVQKGDVSTHSPEGFARVRKNKGKFVQYAFSSQTADRYFWTGPFPSQTTCLSKSDSLNPLEGYVQTEIVDAAFYALLKDSIPLKNKIRDVLLRQAKAPGVDFGNANRWCRVKGGPLNDGGMAHGASDWLSALLISYDFVKDVMNQPQKDTLNLWFYNAGAYLSEMVDTDLDGLFENRPNNNYKVVNADYGKAPNYLVKTPTGYALDSIQTYSINRYFTNRRGSMYRMAALAGVMQSNPAFFGPMPATMTRDLKAAGAKWFKEVIRFGMLPDGMVTDMWRTFDTPDKPNQGWSYACVMLGDLTDIATAYARMGDYSLIDYNTSSLSPAESAYLNPTGFRTSVGLNKSLKLGIQHAAHYLDGTVQRYGRIRAVLYSTSTIPPPKPAGTVPFYASTATGGWSRSPVNAKWKTEKLWKNGTYDTTWTNVQAIGILYNSSVGKPAEVAKSVPYNANASGSWTSTYSATAKWFAQRSSSGPESDSWSVPHLLATVVDPENSRINSSYALVSDTTNGYGHDAFTVQANLYYRDAYNQSGYMRNGLNMKPNKAGMNGAGAYAPGQGSFGIWPDVFFMFGQLENTVWPFPNPTLTVNAGVDAAISLPANTATLNGSASTTLPGTSIASYAWTKVSGPAATLSGTGSATLSLSNLQPGIYVFRLKVTDNRGSFETDEATLTFTGSISLDVWNSIPGKLVSAIPTAAVPSSSSLLTIFEYDDTSVDASNYGDRIRGYVHPPASGNYTFWLSGDNNVELWLSTNENPANKIKIAHITDNVTVPGTTNLYSSYRQWTKFTTQQSPPVALVAGQRYYIEVLHKEDNGGDHVSVGWQLPGGTLERPIPGARLTPFETGPGARVGQPVKEEVDPVIEVFPNPFEDQITVTLNSPAARTVSISLVDMLGKTHYQAIKKVSEKGRFNIDLRGRGLAPGVYFLMVNDGRIPTRIFKLLKR